MWLSEGRAGLGCRVVGDVNSTLLPSDLCFGCWYYHSDTTYENLAFSGDEENLLTQEYEPPEGIELKFKSG